MSEEIKQAQISDLPFPDCVRLRKGMYISTLNKMVDEIVDNSVDESFAGYCNNIAVVISPNYILVEDDGRGIPITKMPGKNITQVESAFTKLHSGGKFGKDGGYGKKTSGMHGVGGSCVQALSSEMQVTVKTGGVEYLTSFEKGHITEHTHEVGATDERGTTVRFVPDSEIWQESEPLNMKTLRRRIKETAFLNPGLNMHYFVLVENDEVATQEVFCYPEGVKTYIEEITAKKKVITDVVDMSRSFEYKGDTMDIQLAFVYTDNYNEEVYTFCNNVATTDNGDHLTGFYMGLTEAVKSFAPELACKSEDIKEGIVAIVSVKVPDPDFEGQNKSRLKMLPVRTAVKNIAKEIIIEYLDKNPSIAKIIISKIESAVKAREAAAKARETARKNKALSQSGTPNKLAECTSKKPEECEVYIVEGDSAGGSAKQGRDRKFQAILPVFGKIQNTEKAKMEDVVKNMKLGEFVKAVKCGIGEEFDIAKLRYHKIIVMSDADVDGYHITSLWLTFFYRYMRELIEAGCVYIACPPRYQVTKGKQMHFAFDPEKLEELKAELGTWDEINYLKGLGEMTPTQLWDTTMNPETRTLIQVSLEDAQAAEQAVSLCMGESVAPRREWIMENAIYAEE